MKHLLAPPNATGIPADWGLESNYCRNPQEAQQEDVWCYTNESSAEWDYCDVAICEGEDEATKETCGSNQQGQANYRGYSNTTVSGRSCQSWSSQWPHPHKYTPEDRPLDGLDGNYCRNPTNETHGLAWCFTTDADVRWEFCNIEACEDRKSATCGSLDLQQRDYRGPMNQTASGIPCQAWSSQQPHPHKYAEDADTIIAAGLEGNLCRNPDGSDGGAWCFTTDESILWEYCNVPNC